MSDGGAEYPSIALMFFNDFEAQTVEAIAERIIPGGDGEIGATDAGVVHYIDCAVAGFSIGLQKVYRLGLRELEAVCRAEFRLSFVGLDMERQDDIVRRFLGPETGQGAAESKPVGEDDYDFEGRASNTSQERARPFDTVILERFFAVVREHAIEGLFCDPVYGGNRDAKGWRLVGFPGVQWGYTEAQMGEGFDGRTIPVKTLSDLRRDLTSRLESSVPSTNDRM